MQRILRTALVVLMSCCSVAVHAQPRVPANAERIQQRIQHLGTYGANPEGGVSRVAYTQADLDGRNYVISLMKKAGLTVSIDAAGNIIGKRAGKNNNLPVIGFGSHIDSVPGGGNYDGDVGSIGAIECIELLNENKIITNHPLEVIIFQNEEGGLYGSAAMCGLLEEKELSVVSLSGKTIAEGIKYIGGDPERLHEAVRKKDYFKAFLELHIEQGAFLDQKKLNIGIVEGIVGIGWWDITVEGYANHAGTTPMNQRKDAMVAAAQLVVAVNQIAKTTEGRQVATVGRIKAEPGAPNVVPGRVVMSLEIRDLSHEKISSLFEQVKKSAGKIAAETQTQITFQDINRNIPAICDPKIQKLIEASAKDYGYSYQYMPSGAGHDTQDLAKIAPAGMIFVPSKDGISHSPREYTSPEDMAHGASVLFQTVLRVDE